MHCALQDAQLNSLVRQAETKPLELALTKIDKAQRMAGQLNQDASALAGDASNAIKTSCSTPPRSTDARLERLYRPMACHSAREKEGAT